MGGLHRKALTPEMFEVLKYTRSIRARLYNQDGQILILPKDPVSDSELDRLWRFLSIGVFFNSDEENILFPKKFTDQPKKSEKPILETQPTDTLPPPPDGLSNVKLISQQTAQELSRETIELLDELKTNGLLESRSGALKIKMRKAFQDFESHPEAMNGLVNIIDMLGGMDMMPEPKKAIKRTIVAMAMKTRGMKAQTNKDRILFDQMVTNLMMGAMLCDVGFLRMREFDLSNMSPEDWKYYKTHPLLSYILISQDRSLSPSVKFTVLAHHRPLLGSMTHNNNFPDALWIREKLKTFSQNFKQEEFKDIVMADVENQLMNLQKGISYDEDISIVAIASEFAELTTEVPNRKTLSPKKAIREIINHAFFSYPDRIVRDFLDHISMSLCENQKILDDGHFVVLSSYSADKSIIWEVGVILTSSRWQSRPVINCFATIKPHLQKDPELCITGFSTNSIRPLFRPIRVELESEFQRRIVYLVDAEEDEDLYKQLTFTFSQSRASKDMKLDLHGSLAAMSQ